MTFLERLENGLIVFDGAMGTQIQAMDPTDEEWDGKLGCSEILNFTAPDKIQKIHEKYLDAGSDLVLTNTFGGNHSALAEYDMAWQIVEVNRLAAQIARKAVEKYATPDKPRFVGGSYGPGTKLVTLGQIDRETLYKSYADQTLGLLEGGVDVLVLETSQDLLYIKTVLLAVHDTMKRMDIRKPLILSITVEQTGTLLVGSEVGAVLATIEPFEIDVLGMNCATGPEDMRPYIQQISQRFNGPIMVEPNAGLPELVDGELQYTLSPDKFADTLANFVEEFGVSIVGGCCGTNPDYIKALSERVKNIKIGDRNPVSEPSFASLFSDVTTKQDPAPFFIGERTNTNGSKLFREKLLAEDWDGIVNVARQQQNTGAHGLDLCVAYTGRDEQRDMKEALGRVITQINLPVFIDSTDVNVMEAALKMYPGRPVINSVNLEDGEERAYKVCALAKRYGAGLIALTIDEKGMAHSVEDKVKIAKRIYDIAVNKNGLRPHDLIFDPLTFTLGSGDEQLKNAGITTLEGIREIKKALPGVFTTLGLSNISFGLNPYSREILNSVYLDEALKVGLDTAIVNVTKIIPLYKLDKTDVEKCLNLIYNRGSENPLFDFINYFDEKAGNAQEETVDESTLPLDERIQQHVIQGNRSEFGGLLKQALEERSAIQIINELLIPAMKIVGDYFGAGKMQLPFVLQSAEVMKFAVDILEPHMEKKDTKEQKSIVLATVRGDVHDIGKNLVDIILSNNGYKVYNLGIKCEVDTMIQKIEEVNADAVGMSGLLVKSTVVMKENLEAMQQRGIKIPVLLGGAALTKSYVYDICAPVLDSPVVYCADAFSGLDTMNAIKNNDMDALKPVETNVLKRKPVAAKDVEIEEIDRSVDIPQPPFWGDKIIDNIDLDEIYALLTESVLFRGRWGYRRGQQSREEYEKLIKETVKPEFQQLKQKCKDEGLLVPKIVYGYYACNSDGDDVIIYHQNSDEEMVRMNFPRQTRAPFKCVADYFMPKEKGVKDMIALQVVTVGNKAAEYSQKLYESNSYKDYLLFHGLSVETAEALAEYAHLIIRKELNIMEEDGASIEDFVVQKYRGSRYSFGYPACPDMDGNKVMFDILKPERIDVTMTDEYQMVPEQTTSAFVVHHPQAKYFNVE